mmetsp:Transcript_8766/g.22977  ORF Transcript_8766/g.22977 Transcript_8766/m.22977 type:complete len:217 (+) Transcript_8766:960-1610(+)
MALLSKECRDKSNSDGDRSLTSMLRFAASDTEAAEAPIRACGASLAPGGIRSLFAIRSRLCAENDGVTDLPPVMPAATIASVPVRASERAASISFVMSNEDCIGRLAKKLMSKLVVRMPAASKETSSRSPCALSTPSLPKPDCVPASDDASSMALACGAPTCPEPNKSNDAFGEKGLSALGTHPSPGLCASALDRRPPRLWPPLGREVIGPRLGES